MPELADRLMAVRSKGNLNFSDLRLWFDRPYPTVRSWTVGYCQPVAGQPMNTVLKRLEVLETLVQYPPFPIPEKLDPPEHHAWFRRFVDAYNHTVSGSDSAERRA